MIGAALAPPVGARKLKDMRRVWALLTLVVTLTGCGVAGTGASAAAGAAAEAQQAADQRRDAEASAQ